MLGFEGRTYKLTPEHEELLERLRELLRNSGRTYLRDHSYLSPRQIELELKRILTAWGRCKSEVERVYEARYDCKLVPEGVRLAA